MLDLIVIFFSIITLGIILYFRLKYGRGGIKRIRQSKKNKRKDN